MKKPSSFPTSSSSSRWAQRASKALPEATMKLEKKHHHQMIISNAREHHLIITRAKFKICTKIRHQKMQTCKYNLRKFGWGMESKLCERWESFLNVWVLKCLFKWIFLEVMGNKHTAGRLTIRFWVKASCSLCRALFQLFTVKWWDNCPSREYKSSLRNSNRTQGQIQKFGPQIRF